MGINSDGRRYRTSFHQKQQKQQTVSSPLPSTIAVRLHPLWPVPRHLQPHNRTARPRSPDCLHHTEETETYNLKFAHHCQRRRKLSLGEVDVLAQPPLFFLKMFTSRRVAFAETIADRIATTADAFATQSDLRRAVCQNLEPQSQSDRFSLSLHRFMLPVSKTRPPCVRSESHTRPDRFQLVGSPQLVSPAQPHSQIVIAKR